MHFFLKYKLTFLSLVVGIVTTLAAYYPIKEDQRHVIEQSLNFEAKKIEKAIRQTFSEQTFTYNWLATQWLNYGQPTAASWSRQVVEITERNKYVKAILWVNPNYQVEWVDPYFGNEHYLALDLSQYLNVKEELEISKRYGRVVSSLSPINHLDRQVHLYTPIGVLGQNKGYIDAIIDTEQFLKYIVRLNIDDGFQAAISDAYTHEELLKFYGDKLLYDNYRVTQPVKSFQHKWSIHVWPTEHKYTELSHGVDTAILFGGLIISSLISFVMFLMTRSRHQAAAISLTNKELESEIAERARAEESLAFMVEYDNLTKLHNRSAIERHVNQVFQSNNEEERQHALMLIDLDNFREINNVVGHKTGDKLIQKVAQRIAKLLPKKNCFLARVGGDEFAVFFEDLAHREAIEVYAKRILNGVDARFILDSYELYLSSSIGITLLSEVHHSSYVAMYRNADSALHQAKLHGKNCFSFYDISVDQDTGQRLELLKRLRRAIERQEFVLYYQPKVHLKTGECIGVEALIRWFDEEQGLVPPDQFIPIAEDTGLIVEIGHWVMDEAFGQLSRWHKMGFNNLNMAINLSGKQLQHPDLIEHVIATQTKYDLSPKHIELELTEQVFIENIDTSTAFMHQVREKGFSLSIDDFGVGYSSLSYLKHFPVDTLKIDRSFIKNIPKDEDDVHLVKTIINLAHNMDLKLIAEGVESVQQLEFLASNGCYVAQGFFFSRPLPGDELGRFLANMQGNFTIQNKDISQQPIK